MFVHTLLYTHALLAVALPHQRRSPLASVSSIDAWAAGSPRRHHYHRLPSPLMVT